MELFDITDEEVGKLKTILTKEEAARRHRECARLRDRQRRRELGAVDRAAYLESIKDICEQRRAYALLLRAKGLSWTEVGKELGISPDAARMLASR